MHTWDPARALGLEPDLDEARAAEMLAGAEPYQEAMRSSGQYGPPVEVPDDASAQDRLMGFIGRGPSWRSPVARGRRRSRQVAVYWSCRARNSVHSSSVRYR